MSMSLTFLGGAETVTGSKTLIEHGRRRLLVDAGLFQGLKNLRRRNWDPVPLDLSSLDGVVLTHAHIDHSGAAPLLVRQGYRGRLYCSPATAALCRILWPDAAHLQEEEAERNNRRGTTRHRPAKPLFTVDDAERAIDQLHPVAEEAPFDVGHATLTLRHAGHIPGANSVLVEAGGRRVLMSGDLGRPNDPLHGPPLPPPAVDAIVMESTYGDREHDDVDTDDELAAVVNRTVDRGGVVVIPAFAVGRTQRILWHLHRLQAAHRIPDVPVFLNSPLADKATRVFAEHPEAHQLPPDEAEAVCGLPTIVRTVQESIDLNRRRKPAIIIAGSGMATGGRVVHHLMAFAPDKRNTVLFTGYQAAGTRGDRLVHGAKTVKIFREQVDIRCEVAVLHGLSAHAGASELIAWLGSAPRPPGQVYLNHGEPSGSDVLRARIEDELGWSAEVPRMGETIRV